MAKRPALEARGVLARSQEVGERVRPALQLQERPARDGARLAPGAVAGGDQRVGARCDRPRAVAERAHEELLERAERVERVAHLGQVGADRAREEADLGLHERRRQAQRREAPRGARQKIAGQQAQGAQRERHPCPLRGSAGYRRPPRPASEFKRSAGPADRTRAWRCARRRSDPSPRWPRGPRASGPRSSERKTAKKIDITAAPRCRSRIPVEIEAGGRRERGAIADMSASGARIVGVRLDLPPGTPVSIRYGSATAPILLAAEMVRATADGFAVKIRPR